MDNFHTEHPIFQTATEPGDPSSIAAPPEYMTIIVNYSCGGRKSPA